MPRRGLHECPEPGCAELTEGGRCTAHRVREPHPLDAFYKKRRWRNRSESYRRAHPICEWPGCTAPSEDVDHIISMTDGGSPFAEENLQALCRRHHIEKTWADRARRRRSA